MWPFAKNRSSFPSRSASTKAAPQPMRANVGPAMPGRLARVLEVAAVDVAIERVTIVRERREHEVHAPVTVVVACVDAHARLRARVSIQRDTRGQTDALESAVPEVVIEEVRVRVVRHEQVDEPIVVVVGSDNAESVGFRAIAEPVRFGRLDELAVADVLEEQIGLAGKSRRADHDVGPVAPDERPLCAGRRVPGRLDIARDVQVEIAVAVSVEERAPGAPAAGRVRRPRRRRPRKCHHRDCGTAQFGPQFVT